MSQSAKAEQSVIPVLCLDLISLVGISKGGKVFKS